MKDVLTAIKAPLQALPFIKRDRDVYVTPATTYIPTGIERPCLGIKDGPVKRIEKSAGVIEYRVQVEIVAFVEMTGSEDEALLKDNSGLMDIITAVDGALYEESLGIVGFQDAKAISESGSKLFITQGKRGLIQKSITFEYLLER